MMFVLLKTLLQSTTVSSTMLSRQTNMMQQLQTIRAQKDKSGTKYTEEALPALSHKKQLRKLIDGYIKKTQNGYFISSDIIEIICNFYDVSKKAFIALIKCNIKSSKIIEFIDIYTNSRYQCKIQPAFYDNRFSEVNASKSTANEFISLSCKLPNKLLSDCKTKHYYEYMPASTDSSLEWNLIFRFGQYQSHITAFHPSISYTQDNLCGDNVVHNTYNSSPLSYIGYNLKIPNLPHSNSRNNNKMQRKSSVVYNKTQQKLYAFVPEMNGIFTLDLEEEIIDYDIDMHWNKWNTFTGAGAKSAAGMSSCMVDNDRFCALINVHNERKSYLYAMNETKLCIPLADCQEWRKNTMSMYHEFYHRIITIGDGSAEYYDINKDKSMVFSRFEWENVNNVYYSPFNPNILYGTTMSGSRGRYSDKAEFGLFQIDLRDGKTKCHNFVKASEGNTTLWSAIYLTM